jgi:hypothetical protein
MSSPQSRPPVPSAPADPRPEPPVPPDPDDCCRGGCMPCVFDLYAEAYMRYERDLAAWTARNCR